jgi:hypothetical protein
MVQFEAVKTAPILPDFLAAVVEDLSGGQE